MRCFVQFIYSLEFHGTYICIGTIFRDFVLAKCWCRLTFISCITAYITFDTNLFICSVLTVACTYIWTKLEDNLHAKSMTLIVLVIFILHNLYVPSSICCSVPFQLCAKLPQTWNAGQIISHTTGMLNYA